MTVDSATFIAQFNLALPDGAADDIAEGDNNFRHVKTVLHTQFAALGNAALSVTAAQVNDVVNKALRAGDTYTGTHDFSGATVTFTTPTFGTPTLSGHAATKGYTDALAFGSALPAISADTKGKTVTNDGTTGSWGDPSLSARTLFFSTL